MTQLPSAIGGYEILGLLGTGGMAEVFLGRFRGPAGFERPVVIKRILPHLAREQHFVDMFRDEAMIAARIHHRNVVEVHELGQDGAELFLVMEYLGGESASALARRLGQRKKLLSFGLCAHLVAEVCGGLHAAHELVDETGRALEIVHRDVCPANIFVTYDGEVKILDFGIALAANRLTETQAGQVKGKYAYMSPEQCQGKAIDRRSDIFSLGIVLYEMSTCRRLFKRPSDMDTFTAVCTEDVVPPSQLVANYPPELQRICLKALSKEPRRRYSTAAAMQTDLLRLSRELSKDKLPEASLARVLRRLFADRIEQKRQMLTWRSTAEGVGRPYVLSDDGALDLPVVPSPDELKAARAAAQAETWAVEGGRESGPHSALGSGPRTGPRGPTWSAQGPESGASGLASGLGPRRWLGWLPIMLLIGGMAGWWWTTPLSLRSMDAKPGSVEAAETVSVELDSTPPSVSVYRDGRRLGTTPLRVALPRGRAPVVFTLKREGYADRVERVVPTEDRTLQLRLRRTTDDPAGGQGPLR